MRKFISLLLFTILFSNTLIAQREANIWYFGGYAGLDFNSGSPVPLLDGALFQHEGCATISDSTGKLLFYTNGIEIWNKNNQQMENGFGLMGGQSATQSGIIVPQPESNSLFYVFTVPEEIGYDGLRYSIVDISKNGGLGSVITKNIFLVSPTEEKVTAVKHYNNRDIWVITHLWDSKAFYVYLVTPDGLDTSPKIFEVGSYHNGTDVHGSMKVSPDGKKLAIIYRTLQTVELFDFNNKTGEISNYLPFNPQFKRGYGIEFSQDASLMYIGNYYDRSTITQFDLNAGTNTDIIQSGIEIGTVSNTHLGALQMGPDGKIYVAKHNNLEGDTYLGVINNPEVRGTGCNFIEDGLYLGGRVCFWGLPTFIQSYFYHEQEILANNFCFGDTTYFKPANKQDLDSVLWNFDDPSSGQNISKDIETKHFFTNPGNYLVKLISYFNNNIDTASLEVVIYPLPVVNLGPDQGLCEGSHITLEVDDSYSSYEWQDGSTNNTFNVLNIGDYWVKVTNQYGCKKSDTINIYGLETPNVFLGNDTSIVYGDSLILDAGEGEYKYKWQDGSTNRWFTVFDNGTYWVEVNNGECSAYDTITVEFYSTCKVNFPNAFTPNSDGFNDEFYAIFNEEVYQFKIFVFNRWGGQIFEADNINFHWDGRYKGKLVPEGVYYWVVEYNCFGSPNKQFLNGSVTILY